MKKYAALIVLTGIIIYAAPAAFSQQHALTGLNPVYKDYSFDTYIEIPGSFTLSRRPNNPIDYAVGVTSGMSGNSSNRLLYNLEGETISYRIIDSPVSGKIIKDITDNPAEGEIFTGTGLSRANSISQTFDIVITGVEFPAAGLYTDTVTFNAYEVTNQSEYLLLTSAELSISVNVPMFVNLSLVPSGGIYNSGSKSYLLDFGFLEKGDRGFLDLIIRANTAYAIDFTSANNGSLANTDPADSSLVPYSFRVDTSPLNLSGGSAVVSSGTVSTPVTGRRHPLEIEILDTDAASSGSYEDTIQITVTAQ